MGLQNIQGIFHKVKGGTWGRILYSEIFFLWNVTMPLPSKGRVGAIPVNVQEEVILNREEPKAQKSMVLDSLVF